jgi:hypothetical protein|tara:strand:+ start:114 stop:305 length:192 start_codon:yes stop_codon:yes gene_type:complete
MIRTAYEIWPAKGSAPLISFEIEADAIAFAENRSHVVPGLIVIQTVTETKRRQVWRHMEKAAA